MKIIDTHMHLGPCKVFGLNITEDNLVNNYLRKYNILVTIVQPFPGAPNPIEIHDRIFELTKKFKGKIYGMVNINPHLDRNIVEKELKRALGDLGFIAIKIHTSGHAISPVNPDADVIFEYASKYKVPVMIHTGPGFPLADPMNVAPRAEQYSEVKIILAHAGFGFFTSAAIWLALKYDNVFLETSWVPIYDLALFVEKVPDKIMFGSDLIENFPVEIAKVEALKMSEDVKEKFLYKNAANIFKLTIQ